MAEHKPVKTVDLSPAPNQEFADPNSLAFQMYMKQKKRKKRNEAAE